MSITDKPEDADAPRIDEQKDQAHSTTAPRRPDRRRLRRSKLKGRFEKPRVDPTSQSPS